MLMSVAVGKVPPLRFVVFGIGGAAAEKRVPQADAVASAPLTQAERIFARVLILAASGVAVSATPGAMLPPPAAEIDLEALARPVAASARIATVLGRLSMTSRCWPVESALSVWSAGLKNCDTAAMVATVVTSLI